MRKITRREFLQSSALATAAAGVYSPVSLALNRGGRPNTSRKRAVVIGSGFGGAVAALRLGEAGISTALVERGQAWPYEGPGSYPSLSEALEGDRRSTWLGEVDAQSGRVPVERYTGMLERVSGNPIDAMCGAGLGGGSLVYGGVLLRPGQELFEQVMPEIDYQTMRSVYYPRALSFISGGPIPDDVLESPTYAAKRAFIENATAAGLDIERSDVGFDWDVIRRELEGELPQAASVGDYVFGCNSGAKNTLDRNYIAKAQQTGSVEVHTLHNVQTITRTFGGGYRVHCDVIDNTGEVQEQHVIDCEYVFMAAGSLNTSKLLLKAQAMGDLPGLNDQVGQAWGTNGDELMMRMGINNDIGQVQGGPPSIAAHDRQNPVQPVAFMHSPSSASPAENTQTQMGMTVPNELGEAAYDPNNESFEVRWPLDANAQSHEALLHSLNKIAEQSGGRVRPGQRLPVWHPLGGAAMGRACDYTGELYGQRNMFVVDGAALPGSAGGVNPSLTIAANAERIMEEFIRGLS